MTTKQFQKEPGLYLGLPDDEYHADLAISSSGVKLILESPFKFWWQSSRNPNRPVEEKTAAQKIGTAYHMLMLEPERFTKTYTIKPGVKSTSVEGMIGEGDYKEIFAMRCALMSNIRRAGLLQGGVAEASLFWRDEATGIMCRCRFDYLAPRWMVDLKALASIGKHDLRYNIPRFGYDVSGAMYSEGLRNLRKMIAEGYKLPDGLPTHTDAKGKVTTFEEQFMAQPKGGVFAFMMQEKEEPFMTRTMLMTQGVTEVGLDKMRAALTHCTLYKDFKPDEPWPTGFEDIEEIDIEDLSPSINYF